MKIHFFNLSRNLERFERLAQKRGFLWRFVVSLIESRYVVAAAGIYILLLVFLGPRVVSKFEEIHGNFVPDQILVRPPTQELPPPKQGGEVISCGPTISKPILDGVKENIAKDTARNTAQNGPGRIMTTMPSPLVQKPTDLVAPQVPMPEPKDGTDISAAIAKLEMERIGKVAKIQESWKVTTTRGAPLAGIWKPQDYQSIVAQFTVYEAKYQDGDWNCNPTAIFDLLTQLRAWSKGRLDAKLLPEVLDVGTDQLFVVKPPFVYLTGHRDFHFTEAEVKNLRDYLMLGGAIWADGALAGERSRFDVAFRREMKRVLPDREFEIVPDNHEVFNTFFGDIGLPAGMNYYREPLEMITIGGEMAVLYSLNGYGHFWESRLNKNGKIEWGAINLAREKFNLGIIANKVGLKPQWAHVYGPHLGGVDSAVIYRNINDETVRDSYKLGMNVVVHLLTRYQKRFQTLPREMKSATELHGRL